MENTAEAVWLLGGDGRWRRCRDFAKITGRRLEHVVKALDVLVKYGFVESIDRGERLFRTVAESPSPMEIAGLLDALRSGTR